MTATQIFTVFAGILALAGAYLYFFGIDPETKRALEKKALKTMGENKMSYLAKDQINKIPTSDQEDVKNLKKTLGNAVGGVTNNPLGETAGEATDRLTAPLTGR
ncbi:hypothetical protein HBI26_012300 [Parastagonospora nodorum]|nr:hypothetical protein HBI09_149940 [Parastagonospora nodorum]KAH4109973.1 hypothetical protein HBH46_021700 [Parastagonospora nodorum]KAH4932908.1 hypothetical protein HBI79_095980 [Parastagonospora nodorum]KAH4998366.1 hypothetical protein HBI77_187010 [Parastagonospora nodorum]KAH5231510.1 hypothetical protein HBI62_080260 [Parastagonospora nodorum]